MTPPELKIDEEFKCLLPALDEKTFQSLEQDIIQNGVHTPIAIWNGYIIDGHNRHAICLKHDIHFETSDYTDRLATRIDVILWIITTQISRRNLTVQQLSYYRGKQYQTEKKRVGYHGNYQNMDETCHADTFHPYFGTARRIAEHFNVSQRTIMRDSCVAQVIDMLGEMASESRQKILAGKSPIKRKELESLSRKPKDELKIIALEIAEGTFTNLPEREALRETPNEASDEAPNEASSEAVSEAASKANDLVVMNDALGAKRFSLETYSRIIADIAALDGALKHVKDSLSEWLVDIDDNIVKNDIKLRLRMQAEAFSALMYQLSEI